MRDEHARPEPPLRGDEAAILRGFLDYQRATLGHCRLGGRPRLGVALGRRRLAGRFTRAVGFGYRAIAGDGRPGARLGGLAQEAQFGWPDGSKPTLRWILLHLIEEHARHNGHADLLRESIDCETGE